MQTANESLPNLMIHQMTAFIGARAIYAAAKLRLADHLFDRPQDAQTLAQLDDVNQNALKRLMHVLCGMKIFHQSDAGEFSLTPLGETLLSEHQNSVRDYVIEFHELSFRAFDKLVDGIKTGAPVFEQAYGMSFWNYLNSDPEITAMFQAGMKSRTRLDTSAILAAYDFENAKQIVDVGGGNGSLLQAILRQFPNNSGILFDLPSAVGTAKSNLEEFRDRCRLVAGDFLDNNIPEGATTYILKLVMHNWPDQDAIKILINCRAAMKGGCKLLGIEGLLSPANDLNFSDFADLTMMVLFGSQERSRVMPF